MALRSWARRNSSSSSDASATAARCRGSASARARARRTCPALAVAEAGVSLCIAHSHVGDRSESLGEASGGEAVRLRQKIVRLVTAQRMQRVGEMLVRLARLAAAASEVAQSEMGEHEIRIKIERAQEADARLLAVAALQQDHCAQVVPGR